MSLAQAQAALGGILHSAGELAQAEIAFATAETLNADNARAIRPSPQGRYYAILQGEPRSVRVFTRDGRTVEPTEGTPRAWAVAWSPDERWTALAASDGVWVFPSERPRGPVIRIPLDAHDLAWAETGLARSP